MLLRLDQVRIKQLLNDLGSLDRIREVLFDDEARDRCGPPATGAGVLHVYRDGDLGVLHRGERNEHSVVFSVRVLGGTGLAA